MFALEDSPPVIRPWPQILHHLVTGTNLLLPLRDLQRSIGDSYVLDLGLSKLWVVTLPEHARRVLQGNACNYRKGDQFETPLRAAIRGSSSVNDATRWMDLRATVQPYLQKNRLMNLSDLVETAWLSLEEEIADKTSRGALINLSLLMECASVSIACQKLGLAAPTYGELVAYTGAVKTLMSTNSPLLWTAHLFPQLLSLGAPERRRAAQQVKHIVTRWIEERLRKDCAHDDFFNALVRAMRESQAPKPTHRTGLIDLLYDELFQILVAAHETVSAGLAWTTHLLREHPDVQERVLHALVGHGIEGKEPTPDYLEAVIKESLRLYPPAWRITRRAIDDDVVGELDIPAGSPVMIFVFGVHRHPDLWNDADAFVPERFLGVTRQDLGWKWLAFGGGPRSCIGGDMAVAEMKLSLTWLLQRYDIVPVATLHREPRVSLAVTLRPREPQRVYLYKRSLS